VAAVAGKVTQKRRRIPADLVFVCECLGAGGIQRVVSTLSNEWTRRGRKVCVVTRLDRYFFELDTSIEHVVFTSERVRRQAPQLLRAVAVRDLARVKLRRSRLAQWRGASMFAEVLYGLVVRLPVRIYFAAIFTLDVLALRRTLARLDAPLVIAMGTPLNLTTLVATLGMSRCVVISERGDAKAMQQSWWPWGWAAAKLYEKANLVTANSRALVGQMNAFVRARKLAFVPNPLWVERGHGRDRDYDSTQTPTVVLSVARLVPEKAPEVLLDGFALCAKEYVDCRLVLVGEGHLEAELRAQASRLGIAERIDWCGLVRDLLPHYDSARVFVLVSRVEGTPNALLEAMGCGVPVIVSDGTPGLLELVEHGVTGLVVPVNDADALCEALCLMLADASLRRRLGVAGRERVLEYELSRSVATWDDALELAR
jgi:glycosyltransferase involved in cell wall biosynthesis